MVMFVSIIYINNATWILVYGQDVLILAGGIMTWFVFVMLMGIVKHVYVFHCLVLAVVFGNLDSFGWDYVFA